MDAFKLAAVYIASERNAPVRAIAHVGDVAQRTAHLSMSKASIKKERAKAVLLDLAKPLRDGVMQKLREVIFGTLLDDPYMKEDMRAYLEDTVNLLWADIQMEIECSIESSVLKQQVNAHHGGPHGGGLLMSSLWLPFRRWFLSHYLPFNKSIFGKLKDPVYLAVLFLTCLPVHGLRVGIFLVLLLCLRFPGPADEFQLLNYVLTFKGLQFFSGGFACMYMGAMKYFMCYCRRREKMLECMDTTGPGSYPLWGEAVDYLGAIALPNVAFALLRGSKKYARIEYFGRRKRQRWLEQEDSGPEDQELPEEEERRVADSIWLRRLFFWDVKCFLFTIAALVAGSALTCDAAVSRSPQFATNVFWCRVMYSLLTGPWIMLVVPAWLKMLTHCYPTGFNRQGACVAFATSAVHPNADLDHSADGRGGAPEAGCFSFCATGAGADRAFATRGEEGALRGPRGLVEPGLQYGQVGDPSSLLFAYDRF